MTGQRYIDEVLLPHVRLFHGAVGDKFVFMDDNATCHRTLAVQECLDSKVGGRSYPPTNKNTLIRALTGEWDKLPQQQLDNVVQSMMDLRGNLRVELQLPSPEHSRHALYQGWRTNGTRAIDSTQQAVLVMFGAMDSNGHSTRSLKPADVVRIERHNDESVREGYKRNGGNELEVSEELGIAQRVISRLWQRVQDDGNVSRCYSTGRPRVSTRKRTGIYIWQLLPKETDGAQRQTCLVSSLQLPVRQFQGRQTVYRHLGHIGLYARRQIYPGYGLLQVFSRCCGVHLVA
ncbi:uncharacterized protein TNCV_4356971 [Trichonephila clavipes]|nr:uncharacterized protein TNCV_4356971 [Trichonephila clavipes]